MEIKVEINYLVFQLLAVVIYDPLEGRGNKALHDVILYFRLQCCGAGPAESKPFWSDPAPIPIKLSGSGQKMS